MVDKHDQDLTTKQQLIKAHSLTMALRRYVIGDNEVSSYQICSDGSILVTYVDEHGDRVEEAVSIFHLINEIDLQEQRRRKALSEQFNHLAAAFGAFAPDGTFSTNDVPEKWRDMLNGLESAGVLRYLGELRWEVI